MAKVTSKYQVTLPKAIAVRYSIRPGDHLDWVPAGDAIRVVPAGKQVAPVDRDAKLQLFDAATERHRMRPSVPQPTQHHDRGWTREELYSRGRSR